MTAELSPKAQEIVAQTRAMLAAGGYNSFSYADVAERVRISKPSIHHHFASKSVLVTKVVALYRAEARAGLEALEQHSADPLAALTAYTGYWAECIRTGAAPFCICAVLATELPTIPEDVAQEVRGHFQDLVGWLTGVFRKGAAQGQFQLDKGPAAAARSFVATVHGGMLAARGLDDPKVFQAIVQSALTCLTRPA